MEQKIGRLVLRPEVDRERYVEALVLLLRAAERDGMPRGTRTECSQIH